MFCDDERPELFDVLGDSAATFRAWDRDDPSRQLTYWLSHPDARSGSNTPRPKRFGHIIGATVRGRF